MANASRLVSSHLMSLVGDARRHGIDLETITMELAAHATSAALAYWRPSDLHAMVDLAGCHPLETKGLNRPKAEIIPFPVKPAQMA